MEINRSGGPAFPSALAIGPSGDVWQSQHVEQPGMSLRDYLAARAPTEELDVPLSKSPAEVCSYLGDKCNAMGDYPRDWKRRLYAKARYKWADAMIAESRKEGSSNA